MTLAEQARADKQAAVAAKEKKKEELEA